MTIAAIETRYAGCRFRSRLEARWAVFFDHLSIEWEYEPQGYLVGPWDEHQRPYLPDFWLPATDTWVEVKGDLESIDWQLLAEAVDWGCGLPGTTNSHGSTRGLLLLGNIPRLDRLQGMQPAYPILQHNKGGYVAYATFSPELWAWSDAGHYFDSTWGVQHNTEWVEFASQLLSQQVAYRAAPAAEVTTAYRAARSARFEHGERG